MIWFALSVFGLLFRMSALKRQQERRAFAQGAEVFQPAFVAADNLFRDIHAQPGTAHFALVGGIDLGELAENALFRAFGNADTIVDDGDCNLVLAGAGAYVNMAALIRELLDSRLLSTCIRRLRSPLIRKSFSGSSGVT